MRLSSIFTRTPKENKRIKLVAATVFTVSVICNALANILPINGENTGAISDSYPNLFAPAGFTFSIWGVIYVMLAGYCVYQFASVRRKQSKVTESVIQRITPYFIAASALNGSWIFAWHYRMIGLSLGIIVGLLICLIAINNILRKESYRRADQFWVKVPFSIYFGWVTIAVIANVTTWLVSMGWGGWGISDPVWTMVVLVTGAIIALVTAFRNTDPVYLAVPIWAYFGIFYKHISPAGFDEAYMQVITVLILLLGVFVGAMLMLRNTIVGYFRR